MEKEKVHHITASPATFTEFERLASSYGLTNKGLLEAMVSYFKVSKADPRDPTTQPTPLKRWING
jgi:hypothetical protein